MWSLNIKFFIRFFLKRKLIFLINILGLSVSLFCLIITYLWVSDEIGMDRFHHSENIYKIMQEMPRANGQIDIDKTTSPLLGPSLLSENPEVEQMTRYVERFGKSSTITWNENSIRVDGAHTDPSFFKIFSYSILNGDKASVLNSPNGLIVSSNLASRLFGKSNPIGKSVHLITEAGESTGSYTITHVVDNNIHQSSLNFDFLLPFKLLEIDHPWINKWGSSCVDTYITLKENISAEQFSGKIVDFIHKKQKRRKNRLFLYLFEDYYLKSDFSAGKDNPTGRIMLVRVFILFGIFILVIGCINYVTLFTAISSDRTHEFATRNILGASSKNIIRYIFTEAMLLTILAMVIAVIGVVIFLGYFNSLTGKVLFVPWFNSEFIFITLVIVLLTSLLSGCYPAILFSEVKPLKGLKGSNWKVKKSSNSLRNGLVVFQFFLAILLMIISQIIETQNDYVMSKDLGFDYKYTVEINLAGKLSSNYDLLREEILKIPSVGGICRADQVPFNIDNSSSDASWGWKDPSEKYSFNLIYVDYDFINVFKIPLIEGRAFSTKFSSDSSAYVINETAAAVIKKDEPLSLIEESLFFWKGKAPIIGITEDFHHTSLHNSIEPLILMIDPSEASLAFIKFDKKPRLSDLNQINKIVASYSPDYPVDITFMNARYQILYTNELVAEKLNKILALVAIVISVLGLFGLSLFNARKSEKIIAIKKVLGASGINIFFELTRKYIFIVLISFAVASPVAYFLSQKWLGKFHFHASPGVEIFIRILLLIMLVTFGTTAYYTVRAVIKNPVKSLKVND